MRAGHCSCGMDNRIGNRLRVAMVSETYPPEVNGVARTIALVAEGLRARGHEIQLVRPRQSSYDRPLNEPGFGGLLRPGMPIPRYSQLRMGLPSMRAPRRVKVIFVPGNHDEVLREHVGTSFGNIRVERDFLHVAADGRRYLLIHGDEFDQVTKYHRWLAILGDHAYDFVVSLNRWLSWSRRTLKVPGYWSLSGYAKQKVKKAVSFIFDFEDSVLRHARERGVDGVICGHIHSAVIRDEGGIAYLNCGDWVDSCTAIVEHESGCMELVRWGGESENVVRFPSAAAAPALQKQSQPQRCTIPIIL